MGCALCTVMTLQISNGVLRRLCAFQESKWWIVAISMIFIKIQMTLLVLVAVVWENVREIVILMNTANKDWHVGIAVVGMTLFLLDALEPLTFNLTITVMIHQKRPIRL